MGTRHRTLRTRSGRGRAIGPRVLLVESSAELGGAQLSMVAVVRALAERTEVFAVLPGEGPLAERLVRAGVEVLPPLRVGSMLERASQQYGTRAPVRAMLGAGAAQARLLGRLRRLRPAVVYCNGIRAQLLATLPARAARVPVVWHVREVARGGGARRAAAALARAASLVIASTPAAAEQRAFRDARVLVVPNGIDLRLFAPRESEPSPPPRIGTVGHLTPLKGHLRFLELLVRLRRELPDLEGSVAGGAIYATAGHADYARRVEVERQRLGLADVCRIEPVLPEEMPAWLAQLTVLVHAPDRPEAFGRALVEAMSVGVPVVSAAAGGAADVLAGAGVRVPPGDDEALFREVLRLLGDSAERARLAAAGRERAAAFDEAVHAERAATAVLSVASGRRRAAEPARR